MTLSIGILADRALAPPFFVWVAAAILCCVFYLLNQASAARGTFALMIGWAAIAGAWHHVWWAAPPSSHLYHWSTSEGRLMTIRGRTVSTAWIKRRDHADPLMMFDIEALGYSLPDGSFHPAAGRLRIQCPWPERESGTRPLRAGELVEVAGRLTRPDRAHNPADFDYRNWLRAEGIEAIAKVRHPEAIVRYGDASTWTDQLVNWRHRIYQRAAAELRKAMSEDAATVAEAMLLGTRTQMPSEIKQTFLACGILHLLAISGINVVIIWWLLMGVGRLVRLSYTTCQWFVIAGLAAYVWLTDGSPPILRAATCACLIELAGLSGRRVPFLQSVSLAAIGILFWNPTDLFHAGAWLSFLSVCVLSVSYRWCQHSLEYWRREYPTAFVETRGSFFIRCVALCRRLARWFLEWVFCSLTTTTAIWLVTVPLVASRFHQLSWIAIVMNLCLAPCFFGLLCVGYAWLFLLLIIPPVSGFILPLFALMLNFLLDASALGQRFSIGESYLPGWPAWWLIVFYVLLFLLMTRPQGWHQTRTWRMVAAWSLLGTVAGALPAKPAGLVCDVLSVGHGLAVVLQGPTGRTLVYDVGSLSGGDVAAECVAGNLWQNRQRRIDALILSHADADHCNGVPFLAERIRPGLLLTHATFSRHRSPTVAMALRSWRSAGGTVQTISAGHRIGWEDEVNIEVWLPEAGTQYPFGNANSVVILVEYAGRRILLTGDLEREGQRDLFRRPRIATDILIAPHHGSLTANTPEFAAWVHPQFAVFSAAAPRLHPRLVNSYPPDTILLNTEERGRIRFLIAPDGALDMEPHLVNETADD